MRPMIRGMKPDYYINARIAVPIFKINSANFGNPAFASPLAKDEIMHIQFKKTNT